ncbi:predicted GPI-anchored protein 58 [Panicum hallii]|uniref:predicted GPI-anchored protein 58 n=1 Tax=Panicum hallii TaxID=206008 RepID=UPI000DF4DCAE|nr:predicted GPI-anchored protein 58 [Panicum hallii]
MPMRLHKSFAVLALVLCATATGVESNSIINLKTYICVFVPVAAADVFTSVVHSAVRAFHFHHRRAVSGEAAAAAAHPAAGPSISPVQPTPAPGAQPPSSSSPVAAPVPSVSQQPAPSPLVPATPPPAPVMQALTPVAAPAPAPSTPAPWPAIPAPPTPAPAAEAPVIQSPGPPGKP